MSAPMVADAELIGCVKLQAPVVELDANGVGAMRRVGAGGLERLALR